MYFARLFQRLCKLSAPEFENLLHPVFQEACLVCDRTRAKTPCIPLQLFRNDRQNQIRWKGTKSVSNQIWLKLIEYFKSFKQAKWRNGQRCKLHWWFHQNLVIPESSQQIVVYSLFCVLLIVERVDLLVFPEWEEILSMNVCCMGLVQDLTSTESSQFSSCQIFVAMEARIPHENLSERFRTLGRTSSPSLWRGESWALSRVSCRWALGCSTECEICGFEMRVFAQPDQNDLSGLMILMMQSQWEELAMVNKKRHPVIVQSSNICVTTNSKIKLAYATVQSCAVLCSLVQAATERPVFSVAYQVGWPRRRRRRGKGIAPQCRCRPGALWSPAKFWTSSEPFKHKTLVQFCSILFNCVHLFFLLHLFLCSFCSLCTLCSLCIFFFGVMSTLVNFSLCSFVRSVYSCCEHFSKKEEPGREEAMQQFEVYLTVPSGRCWSSSYKDGAAHTPTGYWRLGQAHGFVSNSSPKRLPT